MKKYQIQLLINNLENDPYPKNLKFRGFSQISPYINQKSVNYSPDPNRNFYFLPSYR
jgi:hypothetical protein